MKQHLGYPTLPRDLVTDVISIGTLQDSVTTSLATVIMWRVLKSVGHHLTDPELLDLRYAMDNNGYDQRLVAKIITFLVMKRSEDDPIPGSDKDAVSAEDATTTAVYNDAQSMAELFRMIRLDIVDSLADRIVARVPKRPPPADAHAQFNEVSEIHDSLRDAIRDTGMTDRVFDRLDNDWSVREAAKEEPDANLPSST